MNGGCLLLSKEKAYQTLLNNCLRNQRYTGSVENRRRAMEGKNKKQSIVPGMLLFGLLTLGILTAVKKIDPGAVEVVKALSPPALAALFLLNGLYVLQEAFVSRIILRDSCKKFRFLNMLSVTYVGIFSGVALPFGGKAPMQSLYLYHRGVHAGSGFGLMSVQYLLHKTGVVLLAAVFLISDWKWLHLTIPDISPYLVFAYVVCAVIILGTLLIYTWERMKQLVLYGLHQLPNGGKWQERKEKWTENIEILYDNTRSLLSDRGKLAGIMLTETGKLLSLYAVPLVCGALLGLKQPGIYHMLGLASLMFMLSNALPNLAGMGSVEFSFFLIFSAIYGDSTLPVLLLYRLTTYYLPFLCSCIWTLCGSFRYRQQDKG